MAINVDSMFLICRALVPSMIERKYGRIVNITSDMLGLVSTVVCQYLTSKGAVVGFTRALANDVGASGVIVNCIAPVLRVLRLLKGTSPTATTLNCRPANTQLKENKCPRISSA